MAASLEEQIIRFENLLEEMRTATSEAHSALKGLRDERREIEKLLKGGEVKQIVRDTVNEVVKKELDRIAPEIRELSHGVYEQVERQIDKLIDLAMGRDFAISHGREDLRPALAAKFSEWIRELLTDQATVVLKKRTTVINE